MSSVPPEERGQRHEEQPPLPEGEALERALERQYAEAGRRFLEEKRRRTSQEMRVAFNMRSEILTDAEAAPRLAHRHNSHLRTRKIADALYRAYAGEGDERLQASSELEDEHKKAQKNGVFVYEYDEELERRRITERYSNGDPTYVIVESSGSHNEPTHRRYETVTPAADVQFRMPEASSDAKPVFTIPDTAKTPIADDVNRKQLLELMTERPYAVVQVEDIATDEDMLRLRLASHALDTGLSHILRTLNPSRKNFGIEFFTAEIISIKGIVLHSGDVLLCDEEIHSGPISNDRSIWVFDHFRSNLITGFRHAWTLEDRRVPVPDHSHVRELVVSWNVRVARVKPGHRDDTSHRTELGTEE